MYLLFDVGGSHIKLSVSRDGQTIKNLRLIPTVQNFKNAIQGIKKEAEKITNGSKIKTVVGAVRALNSKKTALRAQPTFPLWVNQPFKKELEKALNAPVILENDASLAGVGEAIYGAGRGYKIVVYMTISTGVGGARIVKGKLDESSQGFEPGDQIINIEADIFRRLEDYISGVRIEQKYGKNPKEITDFKIWDEVAKYLALGLHNAIVHWSPDVVVLGGGLMRESAIQIDRVQSYLRPLLRVFPLMPEIKKAVLGEASGLYGALSLAKQKGF